MVITLLTNPPVEIPPRLIPGETSSLKSTSLYPLVLQMLPAFFSQIDLDKAEPEQSIL